MAIQVVKTGYGAIEAAKTLSESLGSLAQSLARRREVAATLEADKQRHKDDIDFKVKSAAEERAFLAEQQRITDATALERLMADAANKAELEKTRSMLSEESDVRAFAITEARDAYVRYPSKATAERLRSLGVGVPDEQVRADRLFAKADIEKEITGASAAMLLAESKARESGMSFDPTPYRKYLDSLRMASTEFDDIGQPGAGPGAATATPAHRGRIEFNTMPDIRQIGGLGGDGPGPNATEEQRRLFDMPTPSGPAQQPSAGLLWGRPDGTWSPTENSPPRATRPGGLLWEQPGGGWSPAPAGGIEEDARKLSDAARSGAIPEENVLGAWLNNSQQKAANLRQIADATTGGDARGIRKTASLYDAMVTAVAAKDMAEKLGDQPAAFAADGLHSMIADAISRQEAGLDPDLTRLKQIATEMASSLRKSTRYKGLDEAPLRNIGR